MDDCKHLIIFLMPNDAFLSTDDVMMTSYKTLVRATPTRSKIGDAPIFKFVYNIILYLFFKFGPFITKCTIFLLCCPTIYKDEWNMVTF